MLAGGRKLEDRGGEGLVLILKHLSKSCGRDMPPGRWQRRNVGPAERLRQSGSVFHKVKLETIACAFLIFVFDMLNDKRFPLPAKNQLRLEHAACGKNATRYVRRLRSTLLFSFIIFCISY